MFKHDIVCIQLVRFSGNAHPIFSSFLFFFLLFSIVCIRAPYILCRWKWYENDRFEQRLVKLEFTNAGWHMKRPFVYAFRILLIFIKRTKFIWYFLLFRSKRSFTRITETQSMTFEHAKREIKRERTVYENLNNAMKHKHFFFFFFFPLSHSCCLVFDTLHRHAVNETADQD